MTVYRGIPIVWSQDFDGAKHHPNTGRGRHGIVSVGTIYADRAYGTETGEWAWSMVVTGIGRTAEGSKGVAPSKVAAIEACDACYVAIMGIEDDYAAAVGHGFELAMSEACWDRRGDEALMSLPDEERRRVLAVKVAPMLDARERRLIGLDLP